MKQARAEILASASQESLAEADVAVWLSERGFDGSLCMKAVRFWGVGATRRLRENLNVLMALANWQRVDKCDLRIRDWIDRHLADRAAAKAAGLR